jgi:transposase-like protein
VGLGRISRRGFFHAIARRICSVGWWRSAGFFDFKRLETMARQPKASKPSEEQQPGLFLSSDLPALPQLEAATKRYVHSGKITCKDEERAAAIAQAFLETGQYLTVARRFHISPNTVHAVVGVLEREGKLDDFKTRVSRQLGLLAQVSLEAAIEAVRAGKCPANVLPINVGVALDKKALLDGDPTARIEGPPTIVVGAGDVLDYLKAKGIQAPAIDVQSTVTPAEPPKTEGQP